MKRFLALLLTFAAASRVLAAETSGRDGVLAEAGGEIVATRNEQKLLGCDETIYDKRLRLALSPQIQGRDASLTGQMLGLARLTDEHNLTPYEADGKADLKVRRGLHSWALGVDFNYADAQLWGCSSSPDERLKHARDVQNKVALPGNSVHTQEGKIAYAFGSDKNRLAIIYESLTRRGDATDIKQILDVVGERNPQPHLSLRGLVGATQSRGNFDAFTDAHLAAGIKYAPTGRWDLALDSIGEARSTQERRTSTKAAVIYRYSRTLEQHTELALAKVMHSEISSESSAGTGVTWTGRTYSADLSAHRLMIDDEQQSASNWYRGQLTKQWTRRQSTSFQATYGSDQPTLMRLITAAAIAHTASVASLAKSTIGRAILHVDVTASYQYSRLVDYQDYAYTVRQAQLGVLATF